MKINTKYLIAVFAIFALFFAACSTSVDADATQDDVNTDSEVISGENTGEDTIIDDSLTTVESDDDVEIGELI